MLLAGLKIEEDKRKSLGRLSSELRKKACMEAISWEGGSFYEKRTYPMYEHSKYKIVLMKPGKEAAPDYNRCNYKDGTKGSNPNDMTPTLLVDGVKHSNKFGFDDIFEMINDISDERALEILGALFFRMAYMLEYDVTKQGHVRLNIDKEASSLLKERCPNIRNIPIVVFLQILEVISLNEDVKYYTLRYNDDFGNATGKRNNLLTYSNLIAVLLGRVSFSKFASSFTQKPRGISAIAKNKAFEAFPDLSG